MFQSLASPPDDVVILMLTTAIPWVIIRSTNESGSKVEHSIVQARKTSRLEEVLQVLWKLDGQTLIKAAFLFQDIWNKECILIVFFFKNEKRVDCNLCQTSTSKIVLASPVLYRLTPINNNTYWDRPHGKEVIHTFPPQSETGFFWAYFASAGYRRKTIATSYFHTTMPKLTPVLITRQSITFLISSTNTHLYRFFEICSFFQIDARNIANSGPKTTPQHPWKETINRGMQSPDTWEGLLWNPCYYENSRHWRCSWNRRHL